MILIKYIFISITKITIQRYTVETTGTYWIEVDLNDSIDKYELLYITYSTE